MPAWTAQTVSWEERETPEGTVVSHRPPYYAGPSLGGFFRMRGYPRFRFNDRSAIYYGAEYRYTPQWQPLREIRFLKFLEIDWWQLVPFFEVGRVAGRWDLGELHSDMKVDGGIGLRIMARKTVLRLDVGISGESWGAWAMVGHPF